PGASAPAAGAAASADGAAPAASPGVAGTGVNSALASQRTFANAQAVNNASPAFAGPVTPPAASDAGNIDVAAAVALAITLTDALVSLADGITVQSGGLLKLASSAETDSKATATGKAVHVASTGIGAAVALHVADVTNHAELGAGGSTTSNGLLIQALTASSSGNGVNDLEADALSGAGAGNLSVAGSLALNFTDVDTA